MSTNQEHKSTERQSICYAPSWLFLHFLTGYFGYPVYELNVMQHKINSSEVLKHEV